MRGIATPRTWPVLVQVFDTQTAMWPLLIILLLRLLNDACLQAMANPFEIQTFVAQFSVKTFVDPILPGLARVAGHALPGRTFVRYK